MIKDSVKPAESEQKFSFQGKFVLIIIVFVIGIVIRSYYRIPVYFNPALKLLVICFSLFFIVSLSLRKLFKKPIPELVDLVFLFFALLFFAIFRVNSVLDTRDKNHITKFLSKNSYDRYIVIGTIIAEPDIRDKKTYLTLRPQKILKYIGRGKKRRLVKITDKVTKGLIRVTLSPSIGEKYSAFDFSDKVQITGAILAPPKRKNPGAFDYKEYLESLGIFAIMNVRSAYAIKKLGTGDISFFPVNFLYINNIARHLFRFALNIKEKMLATIKKTVPYPESAFLAGVQIGLRGGVPKKVQDDFRAAGVSHVLAVSGLHVTIITGMFVIIFSIFKLNRKVYAPIIVFFLIIFTIITGMRPSSQRAALMNSVVLLIYAYFENNIGYSLIFGLAIAGAVVLTVSPLLLFSPAFTLSFGAILSLALLTGPVESFLRKYFHGTTFYILAPLFLGGYLIISIFFPQFITNYWHLLFFVMIGLIYLIDRLRNPFYKDPLLSYGYARLPRFVSGFISAQIAILFGMMWPLSSFYFQRMSLSAPFANFIAIPLIGIIVQIGILAGIIGLIPVIGAYIALFLNAANFIFIKLFLFTASIFAKFPFPYVTKPSVYKLIVYYTFLLLFVFRYKIYYGLNRLYREYMLLHSFDRKILQYAAVSIILILLGITGILTIQKIFAPIPVNFAVLSLRLGQSTIINSGRKTILIDGGGILREKIKVISPLFIQRKEKYFTQEAGETVIGPVLFGMKKREIDYLILTSLSPTNIGGLPFILENFYINRIITPHTFWQTGKLPDERILKENLSWIIKPIKRNGESNPDFSENLKAYKFTLTKIYKLIKQKNISVKIVKKHDSLDISPLHINFIYASDISKKYPFNGLVFEVSAYNRKIFYTGNISPAVQKLIVKQKEFTPDILYVPFCGIIPLEAEFLKKLKSRYAIIQYVCSGQLSRSFSRKVRKNVSLLQSYDLNVLNTYEHGAIIIKIQKNKNMEVKGLLTNE